MSHLFRPNDVGSKNARDVSTGVSASNAQPVKVRGNQAKAVRGFIDALDTLSFDPHEFAYMVTMMPLVIQRQFMRVVIHYFHILSERVDMGLAPLMSEDEYEHSINAHRVHKSISRFFPVD